MVNIWGIKRVPVTNQRVMVIWALRLVINGPECAVNRLAVLRSEPVHGKCSEY